MNPDGGPNLEGTEEGPSDDHVVIGGLEFVPFISRERIARGVARLGAQLSDLYRDRHPVVVAVLNGAGIFHADLIRAMPIPLAVDYVRVSSYHGKRFSSGQLSFSAEPGTLVEARNVIIVEDIVDTGRTVEALRGYFRRNGAASVEVVSLLYKRGASAEGTPPEYVGFEIPDRFVVGYGLDYLHEGRNLPDIHVLAEAHVRLVED